MTAQTHANESAKKGRVEQVIDSVTGGMANTITFMAQHWILFGVFAILWLAFGVSLVISQGSIDSAWEWITGQHVLVQAVIWVLFLPVTAGIWIWETTWPLVLRLVLVAGLAGWNLLVFLPRAAAQT